VYHFLSFCQQSQIYKRYLTTNPVPDEIFVTASQQLGATFYEIVFQNRSENRKHPLIVFVCSVRYCLNAMNEDLFMFMETFDFV
jgi:hypothetical protein